ncbi:MAG: UDP-N-acetylglucosamine 2-epimerase [Planctomycetota bacterium]
MRRIAIATGTRAEWGLLHPVYRALDSMPGVEPLVVGGGLHLIGAHPTIGEIGVPVAAEVPMQRDGETGRTADACALGRGITGFSDVFARLAIDTVVVLGDRIEAFAGAAAASVGGGLVVHVHAGDRAEGVADEAMRHAITKLAHAHACATEQSAERVRRMGEDPTRVVVTGSPAIDGLDDIQPLGDDRYAELGAPTVVVLHHPAGLPDHHETAYAGAIAEATAGERVVWLVSNRDPGCEAVDRVRTRTITEHRLPSIDHLERATFIALLKRVGANSGVLVGNSSAGLIEAAALKLPAINIGPRQAGREQPASVLDVDGPDVDAIRAAMTTAQQLDGEGLTHPYGDGQAGERIAALAHSLDPADRALRRKRNSY